MAKSDDLSTKKIVVLTENDEVPSSKFTSCPEDYTVDQLKRWLKCRGSKQSGKRQELITRVKDCIASGNHHLLDPGIDGGKWLKAKEDREHGSNLTDHKSLVPDPPQKNWRVFPSYDIPSLFNYGHIVCVAKSRFSRLLLIILQPRIFYHFSAIRDIIINTSLFDNWM